MIEKLLKANGLDVKIKIDELKKELSKYDYIGVKIATGVATIDDYADEIAYCESLRKQIGELSGGER